MALEDVSSYSKAYQIQVRNVRKQFSEHQVLRGINLDIERGKINVVIGGSGAGKSVLMKHLIGLLKPDEGQICVDGEDIVPMDDFTINRVRRKFGMLFQYYINLMHEVFQRRSPASAFGSALFFGARQEET